ncbi:hypothetical protein BRM55_23575 [Xanthomonas oryzae pv. oryzae]|nr:hypothetical protein BRM56_22550 [Xanthomonas oryzae pv. oryzae]RBD23305.1 hypothetical protein BRM55_23575 [Xanthomonas oryzae pv. oryzae]RBG29051.1 hypothetical protein BRM54_18030 [Xanthomonas oryzae pv. oryzae]RBG47175.1 hypothetical protein BRM41_23360 [Xanthomonas oryzae pv. oryzae]RBI37620.1 hypothetical protein BRL68_23525 [Xanthomonas oryzae pv. oryzae]
MSEERNARSANPRTPTATRSPGSRISADDNVIYLRDVLRRRREKRSAVVDGSGAGSHQLAELDAGADANGAGEALSVGALVDGSGAGSHQLAELDAGADANGAGEALSVGALPLHPDYLQASCTALSHWLDKAKSR